MKRFIAPGILCITLAFAGFGCQRAAKAPSQGAMLATVNGAGISQADFYAAMRLVCGPAVLERLAEHQVILQEAKKQNVTLDEKEFKTACETIEGQTQDKDTQRILEGELEARMLCRKLLLKDVPETEIHELYRTHREELTEYELFDILLATSEEARAAKKSLSHGGKFDLVASNSSLDAKTKQQGGRIGLLNLPKIRSGLGDPIAELVAQMKPGSISEPLKLANGAYVILKVGEVRSSFPELRAEVEDIFAESGRAALMFRLMSEAQITSPNQAAGSRQSKVNVLPIATPTGVPIPGSSPVIQLPGDKKPVIPQAGLTPLIPAH